MSQGTNMVSVGIIAGPLIPSSQPIDPQIGKHFRVGADFSVYLSITPEVARQWIQELTPIASKDNK